MTFTDREVRFLACWTREVLDNCWTGPAHQLQKEHGATDDDLGVMVTAWSRVTNRPQVAISSLCTDDTPLWFWSSPQRFQSRTVEARQLVEQGRSG